MKSLVQTEKFNLEDLYVGEVYVATLFGKNAKGELDGSYKGFNPVEEKIIATKNADGDYVSVINGLIYSNSNMANVAKNAANRKKLDILNNVESFEKAASVYAKKKLPKKISKKDILKYQEIINAEFNKCVSV